MLHPLSFGSYSNTHIWDMYILTWDSIFPCLGFCSPLIILPFMVLLLLCQYFCVHLLLKYAVSFSGARAMSNAPPFPFPALPGTNSCSGHLEWLVALADQYDHLFYRLFITKLYIYKWKTGLLLMCCFFNNKKSSY